MIPKLRRYRLVSLVASLSMALGLAAGLASARQQPAMPGMDMAEKHKDMFRTAAPESARIDWDDRLKPQPIRYAPIDDKAIIEGDIVIGKLDRVRRARRDALIRLAKTIDPNDPRLGLTKPQKDLIASLKAMPMPAAAPSTASQNASRLITEALTLTDDQLAGHPEVIDSLRQIRDQATSDPENTASQPTARRQYSVVQVGAQYRWPKGIIPYEIDPSLATFQPAIKQAIDHWHSKTDKIHLRPHAAGESDYVRFVAGNGCSSAVGRVGGMQDITLTTGCEVPQIIHEIGHATGLWHEQSRNDRDNYLEIHFENVNQNMVFNFDLALTEGQSVGRFDFTSIMLYPTWAFSNNGQPTMVSRWKTAGEGWGVGNGKIMGLSKGDVRGVDFMYPVPANPPNPAHP